MSGFRAVVSLLLFALMLAWAPVAVGQGLGSLLPSIGSGTEESSETDVDAIIRSAAENGVGIVVIDSEGNVLSQGAAAAAAPEAPIGQSAALMGLQSDAVAFRSALIDRLVHLPDAFAEVAYILRAASPDGTIMAFVWTLIYSLLLFGAGMIFEKEIFGKRIAKHWVVSRIEQHPQGYVEKMPFLVFRFIMGLVGTLVSMLVAYVLGFVIFGPLEDTALQFTVSLINMGYFSCRVVAGIWRMILSPYLPQYRIPTIENIAALRLHWWLTTVVNIGLSAVLFGLWIGELGLNYEVYAFLSSLMSFAVMLLNMVMVAVHRRTVTRALQGGQAFSENSWLIRALSTIWLPVAFVYLSFAWVELTYDLVLGNTTGVPLISGAYGIITTILVVYGVINYFIERGFARVRAIRQYNEAEARAPDPNMPGHVRDMRPRINSFQGLAQRIAGVLAFVAGCYAFVGLWQPNTDMLQESLVDRVLDLIVIIFLGYMAYHAFRIWIDGKIAEEQGDAPEGELGDEGGVSSASRLATLLPLFRNFVLIVIIVSVALILLMELGINVGPLFAGAGIVGVAVGFGSQSLVRDIFSGAFFLFDDAFRKGEYIDVGGVKGTVENISVRSFQLRHHLGALHTIPFGEIQVLTNYSRDWVIMKLPLRVTYDTDVEKVRKLIKKLGQELLSDPVIGANFIQPLKSQGVIEMQDSAMIIRVKFMTKPGDQWLVRKKVYEEIRLLFEREGIHFAHREVTVRLKDGKVEDLTPDQKQEIAAASRDIIEEDDMVDAMSGDDR